MTSSTSSSEHLVSATSDIGPSYVQEDPTILWLPEGPDARGCPAHRDPAAVALLVALLIVTLVAWARTDVSESANNPDWYWMMKADWVNKAPIVIAGDSRAFIGVDPSAFESELGQPAVNVGFSSAKLTSPYLEYVQGAVDVSAAEPKILLGISPFSFTNRRASGTGYTSAVKRNASGWKSMNRVIDQTLAGFAPLPIGSYLQRVFAVFGLQLPVAMSDRLEADVQHEYHPNGWVAVTSMREVADMDERRMKQAVELRKLIETRQENVEALCVKVREWRADGVDVYIFPLPVSQQVADFEQQLFDVRFSELRTRFEGCGALWLDVPDSLDLDTYDGSHLQAESARRLSRHLARKIQTMQSQ